MPTIKPTVIEIKEYHAFLYQTGTAAPVATVLHNTLKGPIVWTRAAAGTFTGTLAGGFDQYKTGITAVQTSGNGYGEQLTAYAEDGNSITLIQSNMVTPFTKLDQLENVYIVIRVYDHN